MKKDQPILHIFLIALPYILFVCFQKGLFDDHKFELPRGHFYIVSLVAVLSLMISIAVGIVGKRIRNIKVSFLALSFISLAQMFALHGITTPHFILHENHVTGAAAQMSMFLATIWLWLSSLPSDNKFVERVSVYQAYLMPVWTLTLLAFSVLGILIPKVVDFLPLTVQPINWMITAIILVLNLVTMFRYYQSYKFSRFPLQLAIVYSAGWIIVSQIIMMTGEKWMFSWWIYHFLLLASMIVMLLGLMNQYGVKGNLVAGLRALFTNDPFERITTSISPSVKSLILSTEEKDTYTAGHTLRVTMYALKLAEELQLKPDELRAIAQGTLLHDVGKIHIPDAVLNKPGKLTSEERDIIEKHPATGYEMCRDLGFMKEELEIIRSHHEKWDGSGYPDQLKGLDIPLLARITAVADVYDALTSERSYRKAWSHEEAVEFLINNKESHFDADCVDAWVRVCERTPEVYLYPAQKINDRTTSKLMSNL